MNDHDPFVNEPLNKVTKVLRKDRINDTVSRKFYTLLSSFRKSKKVVSFEHFTVSHGVRLERVSSRVQGLSQVLLWTVFDSRGRNY